MYREEHVVINHVVCDICKESKEIGKNMNWNVNSMDQLVLAIKRTSLTVKSVTSAKIASREEEEKI